MNFECVADVKQYLTEKMDKYILAFYPYNEDVEVKVLNNVVEIHEFPVGRMYILEKGEIIAIRQTNTMNINEENISHQNILVKYKSIITDDYREKDVLLFKREGITAFKDPNNDKIVKILYDNYLGEYLYHYKHGSREIYEEGSKAFEIIETHYIGAYTMKDNDFNITHYNIRMRDSLLKYLKAHGGL